MFRFFSIFIFTLTLSSLSFAGTPSSKNPKVIKWIKFFQKNDQNYFNHWLSKSEKKLPKIQSILIKQGLPTDLGYLPIIESGLSATAVSSANATGYWQFMRPTALQYGLRVNWWLDERRDLIKSTWAAGRYLRTLYSMFDDWKLALAAYNMGENRLKKLIKRHGTNDFWILSEQEGFPSETRDYVPKFLAAALIAKNPKHYGFDIKTKLKPYSYTYQFVPGGTDLMTISSKLKISSAHMRELNPELKRALVPREIASHRIRVPKGFREKVALYFSKDIR